jgi:hypothetical protein
MKKGITIVAVVTALVLSIPLIAMQFSSEVNWSLSDFVIMGTLLFGTGLAFVVLSDKLRKRNQRIALGIVMLFGLMYVWAELAVGVFTNIGS